mmetsp:Transcript_59217/g.95744  ORF Transcript_59217/g.95744 Transcript_59217/m.95744 type:complete len:253 (+) Transcript_59217:786-1544(+)
MGKIAVVGNMGLLHSGLLHLAHSSCAGARVVGVELLGGDTAVLDDPLIRILHDTAIAALILALVALNELLLGERDEGVAGDHPGTLNGTGGGKRPAAAALALVLDVGHSTLGAPVYRGGDGRDVPVTALGAKSNTCTVLKVGVLEIRPVAIHLFGELGARHVRKLVDGHVESFPTGLVQLVVCNDELNIGLVHGVLGHVLSALVHSGKLGLPGDKLAVHLAIGRNRGAMRWGLSWQIERGNGRGDRENRKHA